MDSAPYADEWQALREKRQKEFEQMVTLMRWGALMEITNEIANECGVQTQTPVIQKTVSGFPTVSRFSTYGKGRV